MYQHAPPPPLSSSLKPVLRERYGTCHRTSAETSTFNIIKYNIFKKINLSVIFIQHFPSKCFTDADEIPLGLVETNYRHRRSMKLILLICEMINARNRIYLKIWRTEITEY